MKKKIFIVLVALLSTLAVWAAPTKKVTIGVTMYNLRQDNLITWYNNIKSEAARLDVTLLMVNADMVPSRQEAAIAQFISRKVDAILIGGSIDPPTLNAAINEAIGKGIPVLAMNDAPRQGIKMLTEAVNWYGNGFNVAKYACTQIDKRFGGKGNVALLVMPELNIAQARTDGHKDALAKFSPNSKVVAQGPTNGTQITGLNSMAAMLQAHPEINVVMAVNDESAIGAISAIKAAGKNPADYIIVGFDGEPQALDLIKKGELTASVVDNSSTFGAAKLIFWCAYELAVNGDKSPLASAREIYAENPVLSKENIDAFIAENKR